MTVQGREFEFVRKESGLSSPRRPEGRLPQNTCCQSGEGCTAAQADEVIGQSYPVSYTVCGWLVCLEPGDSQSSGC